MSLYSACDQTLKVVILLVPQSSLMSLASTLDTMRAANRISRRSLFEWQVTTLDGEAATLSCGQRIYPDAKFSEHMDAQLMICIAGFSHQKFITAKQLVAFKNQAKRFDFIGGVDSGSWVLAKAGFLNHRQATIHWEDLEDFRDAYPNIEVKPDRYVIDGKFFTTGGAAPTIDLFLHLIHTRYGKTLALEVASVFIYDGKSQGQVPQSLVTLGALEVEQPRVAAAVRLMEQHLDSPIGSEQIASELGVSKRTLETLFRKQLSTSPQQYFKRLRLQAAKRLLIESEHNMQEVAIRCGFNSLAAFSREYKRFFSLSPLKFRQQFKLK